MDDTNVLQNNSTLWNASISNVFCPDLFFPDENRKSFFTYNAIISIISVFGIVGNTISGLVFFMPQMRSSYNLLLFSLAISDSLLLISNCVCYGTYALWDLDVILDPNHFSLLFYFFFTIRYVAFTSSTYVTALTSFERYIALCRPLKALIVFPTKKRSACYILLATAFSTLYNLPKWLELQLCEENPHQSTFIELEEKNQSISRLDEEIFYNNVSAKRSVLVLVTSSLIHNEIYSLVYRNIVDYAFNFIIPIALIVLFNVWIFQGLREASERRQTLTSQRMNENSKILMLIAAFFLICGPYAWHILELVLLKRSEFFSTDVAQMHLYLIRECFLAINASVNFLIYYLCGSKFREQLSILPRYLIHPKVQNQQQLQQQQYSRSQEHAEHRSF